MKHVGDRTEEIHRANLFDMGAKYADIVSETEAIEKMKAGWKLVSECESTCHQVSRSKKSLNVLSIC